MSFVKLCKESELTGEIKIIQTKFGRIAVVRSGDRIHAFQDVCTHDNGTLSGGTLSGCEIECPRHGARFDIRTGKALCMPATEDIEVYPVRVNAGDIEADFS